MIGIQFHSKLGNRLEQFIMKIFVLWCNTSDLLLAVFIKSEMLREVRENCFCKYQRYPIITIESQNKTIMTDKRHNDVIVNYTITNILVTQLELSLQCPPKLLLWFVISFVFAKRSSTTMGSSLFVTLVIDFVLRMTVGMMCRDQV